VADADGTVTVEVWLEGGEMEMDVGLMGGVVDRDVNGGCGWDVEVEVAIGVSVVLVTGGGAKVGAGTSVDGEVDDAATTEPD